MKKSAPHPATRKTPTGGTVDLSVEVSYREWTKKRLTEDCNKDQEECFDHVCDWFLPRALMMYLVMRSRCLNVGGCLFAFCVAQRKS
jgi:hypothetical protein